jgi:hypothetical protein
MDIPKGHRVAIKGAYPLRGTTMREVRRFAEAQFFHVVELELDNGMNVTLVGDKAAVEAIVNHLLTLAESWANLETLGFKLKQ